MLEEVGFPAMFGFLWFLFLLLLGGSELVGAGVAWGLNAFVVLS